jgi:hypothetical protein
MGEKCTRNDHTSLVVKHFHGISVPHQNRDWRGSKMARKTQMLHHFNQTAIFRTFQLPTRFKFDQFKRHSFHNSRWNAKEDRECRSDHSCDFTLRKCEFLNPPRSIRWLKWRNNHNIVISANEVNEKSVYNIRHEIGPKLWRRFSIQNCYAFIQYEENGWRESIVSSFVIRIVSNRDYWTENIKDKESHFPSLQCNVELCQFNHRISRRLNSKVESFSRRSSHSLKRQLSSLHEDRRSVIFVHSFSIFNVWFCLFVCLSVCLHVCCVKQNLQMMIKKLNPRSDMNFVRDRLFPIIGYVEKYQKSDTFSLRKYLGE